MKVAICIITFRRPEGLAALLRSLADQRFARVSTPALNIIVVDNDAAESARQVCEQARCDLGLDITYLVEQAQGIPYARNASLRAVPSDIDYIALIDDDEVAATNWLDELLACIQATKAECVGGPVGPALVEGAPSWVVKGRFFDRRRERDRSEIDKCGTGNVVFSAHAWRKLGLLFDTRLRFVGSTDSLFFIQARRAGWRIVWCDTAHAFESVPLVRCTARWIVRRQFRTGVSLTLCHRLAFGWLHALVIRTAKSAVFVLWGLFDVGCAPVGGKALLVRGVAKIARGIGGISAFLGYRFEEYRPDRLIQERAWGEEGPAGELQMRRFRPNGPKRI